MSDTIPPIMNKIVPEKPVVDNNIFNSDILIDMNDNLENLLVSEANNIKPMKDGFNDLSLSINNNFSLLNKQQILSNDYLGEMYLAMSDFHSQVPEIFKDLQKEVSIPSIEPINKEDKGSQFLNDMAQRRLDVEKDRLEKDKNEALALYDEEKDKNRGVFEKFNDNADSFFADESQSKDTKEYLQSAMLGPLNVIFNPIKNVLKDNNVNIMSDLAQKRIDKKDRDKQLKRDLLESKYNEKNNKLIEKKENELLDFLDLGITKDKDTLKLNESLTDKVEQLSLPYSEVSKEKVEPLIEEKSFNDEFSMNGMGVGLDEAIKQVSLIDKKIEDQNYNKELELDKTEDNRELIEQQNKTIIDELEEIDKSVDQTTKATTKNKPKSDWVTSILTILPFIVAAGASLPWGDIWKDISQGLYTALGIDKLMAIFDNIKSFLTPVTDFLFGIKDTIGNFLLPITDAIDKFMKPITDIANFLTGGMFEKMFDFLSGGGVLGFLESDKSKLKSNEKETQKREQSLAKEEKQLSLATTDKDRLKHQKNIDFYNDKLTKLKNEKSNIQSKLPNESEEPEILEDGIIYKDGKVIHTSEDDNIFATKNDLTNIGFDNRSVETQSKTIAPDMSLEIRDLLTKQNDLLIQLNTTIQNKPFNNNIVSSVNQESSQSMDLDVLRQIGKRSR